MITLKEKAIKAYRQWEENDIENKLRLQERTNQEAAEYFEHVMGMKPESVSQVGRIEHEGMVFQYLREIGYRILRFQGICPKCRCLVLDVRDIYNLEILGSAIMDFQPETHECNSSPEIVAPSLGDQLVDLLQQIVMDTRAC